MARWLMMLAVSMVLVHAEVALLFAQESPQPRFPALDESEAWGRMPQERPALPAWARVLAEPLPKTTAAMLELDYLHRVENPVGATLAGKLRWAAADAIGCDYARRCVEADLRRAGLSDDDLRLLAGDGGEPPEKDRAVLAFARRLTLAAHEVTDDEVAVLIEQFGPETMVGVVHTLAFANFQNRIFLALGIEVEPDGPLPPMELQIDAERQAEVPVPPRRPWEEVQAATGAAEPAARPDWGQRDLAAVEQLLDRQKHRTARIPLPGLERLGDLPPAQRERRSKIVWSYVSMGWQPRLTQGWFRCMQAFQKEAKLDRVFENSVFWVVTRSNECFY